MEIAIMQHGEAQHKILVTNERWETTQHLNAQKINNTPQTQHLLLWWTCGGGARLNLDCCCGSCPLQFNLNFHKPLTLEPNLHAHMLACADGGN
jgi:hypothetical protein